MRDINSVFKAREITPQKVSDYKQALADGACTLGNVSGAVLLCALLFFLWMEESRRLEDPLSMIKIERNVWRRVVLAKHIFGYDLENYCERRFLRFKQDCPGSLMSR
jgi:hypothetical protein